MLFNDKLKPYIFAKAMQVLIVCLLHPACSFIIQTQILNQLNSYNGKLRELKEAMIKFPSDEKLGIIGLEFPTYDL
jgi:hypothetical protein